jgi:hypothetical protein
MTVTGSVPAVLCPQPFTARTVICPEPMLAAVVLIVFVVLVPTHPEGSVQIYDVAPPTGRIEYVWAVFPQIWVLPVTVPGGLGALPGEMLRVRAMEIGPQGVVTCTEIVAGVVPGPGVTVIVFELEKPVQPGGSVHVYVPPGIEGTEYCSGSPGQ